MPLISRFPSPRLHAAVSAPTRRGAGNLVPLCVRNCTPLLSTPVAVAWRLRHAAGGVRRDIWKACVLETVAKVAGIGGIALGVVLLLFREVVRKNIFPKLSPQDAYRLL